MDSSVSSQLDSSLNESVTDWEENSEEGSPSSPAAPSQVAAAPESSGGTDVRLPDGAVQVQSVIQAPKTSVIQSPQVQTVQIPTAAELEDDAPATDTQKRREILPGRRKILNELSAESPPAPKTEQETVEVVEVEEEVTVSSTVSTPVSTSIFQTSSGQYIAFTQGRAFQLSSPGAGTPPKAQTVMVAGSPTTAGATILQCAAQNRGSPQQFFIQGGQVLLQAATGDMPTYQLRSPNSGLAHSIMMAASPVAMQSPSSQHAEEITRKREVRLMKNREAARECRRKKKEYVKCLENRVAVLENQNKTLIEELKALKDIYCHKAE